MTPLLQPVHPPRQHGTRLTRFVSGVLSAALLSVSPMLLVATGIHLKTVRGPYWLGWNSDPEYAYLFNSLLITQGKVPFLVEHPGTPIQELGAAVIGGLSAVRSRADLAQDVLKRPESYLAAIHLALLIVTALLVFFAGVLVLWQAKSLLCALLIQSAPWLSVNVIEELSRVRPDALLIGWTCLFTAVLFVVISRDATKSPRSAALLGVVVGCSIATKFTALPLLLAPLLLLQPRQTKLLFLSITAGAFLLVISPAIPKVLSIGKWVMELAVHSGDYGSGPMSVIDPKRYLPSLLSLARHEYLAVALVLVSGVAWIALQYRSRDAPTSPDWRRVLGVVTLMQIGQFLMVAKHPAPHYLLPAIGTLGINPILIWFSRDCLDTRTVRRLLCVVPVAVALVQVRQLHERAIALATARADQESIARTTQSLAQAENCLVIYYYRSSARPYALQFGNLWSMFTGLDVVRDLQAQYPNVLFDRGGFHLRGFDWRADLDPAAVLMRPCVLLEGTTLDPSRLPSDVKAELLFSSADETLYRLSLARRDR